MNKRLALYEERGDLLERKAISEKYSTGWYLQARLEEINEQIRVIENVTPQAQKTYFDALSVPAIEVEPWNEIPDAMPEFGGAAWFAGIDPIPYGEVLAIPHPTRPGTLIATYKGLVKLYKESIKK